MLMPPMKHGGLLKRELLRVDTKGTTSREGGGWVMTGLSGATASTPAAQDGEAAVRVFTVAGDVPDQIPDEALSATAQLLANLEVDRVIELFAREIDRHIGIDGLVYQRDEAGFTCSIGAPAPHALRYRLALGEHGLGEFTLTRRRRFTAEEIRRVENQVCGLILALRNAWLYQEALARQAA